MRIAGRLDQSPWARARWLILAPHPDDETLGVGALIAHASKRARLAGVAYLTDGAGSHPNSGQGLAMARRAEAALALQRLTGARVAPVWIGWPDGRPVAPGGSRYDADVRAFAGLLGRRHVDAVAVTAEAEPHCDHTAAYRFAMAAAKLAGRRIAVFEYLVWAKVAAEPSRALRTGALPRTRRLRALQAHSSQTTPRFGPGFRLPIGVRRLADRDTLYLREARS